MFTALTILILLVLIALTVYCLVEMPVYSLLTGTYEILGHLLIALVKIVSSMITGSDE